MGLYFRKSVKLGPLRLTASKSGVSVSAGVKGARLTSGPRGTYITVGAHGLTYRQRIDRPPATRSVLQVPNPRPPAEPTYDPTDPFAIQTADVSELVDASNAQVLAELNERARLPAYAPWIFGLTIVFFLFTAGSVPALAWLVAALGAAAGVLVAQGDRHNRTTPLYYDLADGPGRTFADLGSLVKTLGGAQQVWRVQTRQANHDWKRNAGASHLLNRSAASAGVASPPFIRTNIEVTGINAGATQLYFMPDHLLVRQQGQYGAVDYRTLQVTVHPTSFIEDGRVPRDAEVIRHTWQYVNKKGGPDRRFKNNRQLPVMRYGEVQLTSPSGLNLVLHVSNAGVADSFARGVTQLQQRALDYAHEAVRPAGPQAAAGQPRSGRPGAAPPAGRHGSAPDRGRLAALRMLQVPADAGAEEIREAYRRLVQTYHPDKVGHLAPEFREVAEKRMQEINAAYANLTRDP
jgi:hypothetical protein